MLNRKNGNGKKVRKPITSSAPKNEKRGAKEPKETKVTTLLLLGALAVTIVMVLAVMTMKVIVGDAAHSSPEKSPELTEQKADAEQVMDAVYLALFSYGLDKNSIKDSSQITTDSESEIKLSIDPFHIETVELQQTLEEKLAELGMTVTGEDTILGTNGKVKLLIEFLEPEILQEVKPNSIAFLIDDCGYSIPLAK